MYPSDYKYSESYGDVTTSPININGLSITTERKRCGYINGEYINLSARKQGKGVAYIAYNLSRPIYKIDINLSLWSNSEYLKPEQSKVSIQVKNSLGEYEDTHYINIDSLSIDRKNPNLYTFVFDQDITDFRIYVKTYAIGTANKGRVSIGNLSFYCK